MTIELLSPARMRLSLLALLVFGLSLQGWGLAAYHFSQAGPDVIGGGLLFWGCLLFALSKKLTVKARELESLTFDTTEKTITHRSGESVRVLGWNALEWIAVGSQSEGSSKHHREYSYRLYAQLTGLGRCALGHSYPTQEEAEAGLSLECPRRPTFSRFSELYVCLALLSGVAATSVPLIQLLKL